MDLSWISAISPRLLTCQTALLLVGGFVVGIFSVIVGGGFFVSGLLLQFLFPSVSYGAIVGNLKVGSFFAPSRVSRRDRRSPPAVPDWGKSITH